MLRTLSLICSSTFLQLIDAADKDKFAGGKIGGNETNLSNLSTSKKSTKTGYPTFKSTKKGGGNIKKGVKAAKGSDDLTLTAKKAFNHLRYAFIQAPILQYFDLEWHIQIETDVLGNAIGEVLSQLTLGDLG